MSPPPPPTDSGESRPSRPPPLVIEEPAFADLPAPPLRFARHFLGRLLLPPSAARVSVLWRRRCPALLRPTPVDSLPGACAVLSRHLCWRGSVWWVPCHPSCRHCCRSSTPPRARAARRVDVVQCCGCCCDDRLTLDTGGTAWLSAGGAATFNPTSTPAGWCCRRNHGIAYHLWCTVSLNYSLLLYCNGYELVAMCLCVAA
jgi:hypothetical protein